MREKAENTLREAEAASSDISVKKLRELLEKARTSFEDSHYGSAEKLASRVVEIAGIADGLSEAKQVRDEMVRELQECGRGASFELEAEGVTPRNDNEAEMDVIDSLRELVQSQQASAHPLIYRELIAEIFPEADSVTFTHSPIPTPSELSRSTQLAEEFEQTISELRNEIPADQIPTATPEQDSTNESAAETAIDDATTETGHTTEKGQELLEELQQLDERWSQIDKRLLYSVGEHHPDEYAEVFGSLEKALHHAGVTESDTRTRNTADTDTDTDTDTHTDDQLEGALQEAGIADEEGSAGRSEPETNELDDPESDEGDIFDTIMDDFESLTEEDMEK